VKDLKNSTHLGSRDRSWSKIFRCRPRYLYQGGIYSWGKHARPW